MRLLLLSLIGLLLCSATLAQWCDCNCCISKMCDTHFVGSRRVFNCGNRTCSSEHCVSWYHNSCPPSDAPGLSLAVCRNDGARQSLSALVTFTGLASVILLARCGF